MTEEIKKEEQPKIETAEQKTEQGLPPKPETPPTDFKVAEIWIRSGQIMLDATENFWADRCRALGLLDFCKDIVKTAKAPEKPKIIVPGNGKMLNFARNLFRRRR